MTNISLEDLEKRADASAENAQKYSRIRMRMTTISIFAFLAAAVAVYFRNDVDISIACSFFLLGLWLLSAAIATGQDVLGFQRNAQSVTLLLVLLQLAERGKKQDNVQEGGKETGI